MGNTGSTKSGATLLTVLGVIALLLGVFALLAPGLAGSSVMLFLGILVLLGGVVRMVWAFQAPSFGRGLFKFAVGLLTLFCGAALVANPVLASGVLTILLAVYFFADGLCEIGAGFYQKPTAGWGWLVFAGLMSLLLGVLLWAQFPLSGAWALGVLLGIKLFFVGLAMVAAGSAVRASQGD